MTTTTAHASPDTHGDAHNTGGSVALYFIIFVALLALLFISVGIAYFNVAIDRRSALTVLGFTIASIKAILIILYFMHVRFGSKLTALFALGSFFFLLIMVCLTLNDYGTRIPPIGQTSSLNTPAEPSGEAEEYREGHMIESAHPAQTPHTATPEK